MYLCLNTIKDQMLAFVELVLIFDKEKKGRNLKCNNQISFQGIFFQNSFGIQHQKECLASGVDL